ncbi:MAG: hypothetical protein IJR68_13245 [Fretibacterium sp.]|nr:hypothetical protein [Fretibacterium sp.]
MPTAMTQEERAREEIRLFVDEGLRDLDRGALYALEDVFDELKERYGARDAAVV